ncbi:MAG TPA: cupredoxin family copper-binding protein [Candidatus Nanoarchaeia archaeon]|nr:cupredoxin family copper-binding protein [Candidatus Nanoarchaeia archaeon]
MKILLAVGFLIMISLFSACTAYQAAPSAPTPAATPPSATPTAAIQKEDTSPIAQPETPPATTTPSVTPPVNVIAPAENLAINKEVDISGFAFNPSTLTITKGTTVAWTNKDSARHDVVSDTRAFVSERLSQDGAFEYTFDTSGTYRYICSIHPSMKGTIIVE